MAKPLGWMIGRACRHVALDGAWLAALKVHFYIALCARTPLTTRRSSLKVAGEASRPDDPGPRVPCGPELLVCTYHVSVFSSGSLVSLGWLLLVCTYDWIGHSPPLCVSVQKDINKR